MISLIIPTKNEERYLPKLLDSIKKQKFGKYEILVADAGSTDKTTQIAKKYGCRVVKGGSPSFGRNQGAKFSKYDYLFFLDADIILPNNFFSQALKQIKEEKLDLAGTLQEPIKTNKIGKDLIYKLFHGFANKSMIILQYTTFPCMQNCMFVKKGIHKKIKGFDETLIFGEDSEYSKRASRIGKFRILNTKKVKISLRRLEEDEFIAFLKYFYFNAGRLLGREFRGKSRIKYF